MSHELRFQVEILPDLEWSALLERFRDVEALGFDLAVTAGRVRGLDEPVEALVRSVDAARRGGAGDAPHPDRALRGADSATGPGHFRPSGPDPRPHLERTSGGRARPRPPRRPELSDDGYPELGQSERKEHAFNCREIHAQAPGIVEPEVGIWTDVE